MMNTNFTLREHMKSLLECIDIGTGEELKVLIVPTRNKVFDIVIDGDEAGSLAYTGDDTWFWENKRFDQIPANIIGKVIMNRFFL